MVLGGLSIARIAGWSRVRRWRGGLMAVPGPGMAHADVDPEGGRGGPPSSVPDTTEVRRDGADADPSRSGRDNPRRSIGGRVGTRKEDLRRCPGHAEKSDAGGEADRLFLAGLDPRFHPATAAGGAIHRSASDGLTATVRAGPRGPQSAPSGLHVATSTPGSTAATPAGPIRWCPTGGLTPDYDLRPLTGARRPYGSDFKVLR